MSACEFCAQFKIKVVAFEFCIFSHFQPTKKELKKTKQNKTKKQKTKNNNNKMAEKQIKKLRGTLLDWGMEMGYTYDGCLFVVFGIRCRVPKAAFFPHFSESVFISIIYN